MLQAPRDARLTLSDFGLDPQEVIEADDDTPRSDVGLVGPGRKGPRKVFVKPQGSQFHVASIRGSLREFRGTTTTGLNRFTISAMPASILSIVVAVAAILAVLAPGILYQSGSLELRSAINLYRYAAYLGIAAMVLSVLSGLWSLRTKSTRGQGLAVVGLVAGFVAFWGPYTTDQRGQSVPPIHDISTDTIDPPVFVNVMPLREGTNPVLYLQEIAEQQRQAYPEIQPVLLNLSAEETYARALQAAQASGWDIVGQDAAAGRIEATATTRWMGFKDDVVIRLRREGDGTRVDVRSVSRVGRSDIGTNALRIAAYLELLKSAG